MTHTERERVVAAARTRVRFGWKAWMAGFIVVVPAINSLLIIPNPLTLAAALGAGLFVANIWEINIIMLPAIRDIVHDSDALKAAMLEDQPASETPVDTIVAAAFLVVVVTALGSFIALAAVN